MTHFLLKMTLNPATARCGLTYQHRYYIRFFHSRARLLLITPPDNLSKSLPRFHDIPTPRHQRSRFNMEGHRRSSPSASHLPRTLVTATRKVPHAPSPSPPNWNFFVLFHRLLHRPPVNCNSRFEFDLRFTHPASRSLTLSRAHTRAASIFATTPRSVPVHPLCPLIPLSPPRVGPQNLCCPHATPLTHSD